MLGGAIVISVTW